jgi:hypothetical protein
MKKRLVLSLITGALLLLVGWSGYAHGQAARPATQVWEYRVDPVPGTARSVRMATEFDTEVMAHNRAVDEKLLNQRAAEGWELTAVGNSFYYFRRAR